MIVDPLVALKACALLLPWPFSATDPDGENEILRWLTSVGVEPDSKIREHLAICAHEAHDAAVQLNELPMPRDVPRLLHPLSAEELAGAPPTCTARSLRAELLDELVPPAGTLNLATYCKLWRGLMQHPAYSRTPADPRLPDHSIAAHRSLTAALAGATRGGDRPALLALHVGPVQSFIEAARRTHDLSIGSYSVGFLAFAGARALAEALGPDVLINPDVSCRPLADHLFFKEPLSDKDKPRLLSAALMNKVLAVVPDRQAEELARKAMAAVSKTWTDMAEETRAYLESALDGSRPCLSNFMAQIQAHLEIDAVIQPWPARNAEIQSLLAEAKLLDEASKKRLNWLDDHKNHPGAACGDLMDLSERILAAHRKGVEPQTLSGDRRPKCTVCGRHEQMGPIADHPAHQQGETRAFFDKLSREVQKNRGNDDTDTRPSLQLVHGEGLCAVCLTKRFAPELYYGGPKGGLGLLWERKQDRPLLRFPSTASIASAPLRLYLQEVRRDPGVTDWLDWLDQLHARNALDFTPPQNLLHGLGPIGDNSRWLAHDGTWLYESAYDPDVAWRGHFSGEPTTSDEKKKEQEQEARVKDLMPEARRAFRRLGKALGGRAASSYYAVIVLDGDNMGAWKSGRHELSPKLGELIPGLDRGRAGQTRPLHPALHGELSRRVAKLGIDLQAIVDRHLGRLVYHGGDDLLAILPLATALPCLEKIRGSFRSVDHLGERVTLSAGVAVSHWREPLSRVLAAAREAEKTSKNKGRSRFTIHADKRSGETHKIVLPWEIETIDPIGTIEVIPTLLSMLESRGEDGLAGTKATYRLREELPAIGSLALRPALLDRIDTLVFSDRKPSQARKLIRALLTEGDRKITRELTAEESAGMARRNAEELVDLLLFIHFLLREEHGIETDELLTKLPKKEAML